MATWGFLTNHAHVLIHIARDPLSTGREIALGAGITERAAISVLHDLRRAGVISTERRGRQNINTLEPVALARHRPWGASDMEIPDSVINATLRGLAQVAGVDASAGKAAKATAAPPSPAGRPSVPAGKDGNGGGRRWGFLTTHALVLIFVTQHPHSTVREISLAVGVTERAIHSVLQDLCEAGIVERERTGRRNSYSVSFYHLSGYRREGTAPDLVPDSFVSPLIEALRPLQQPDFPPSEDEPHPIN